jgi:hypothetical protein
MHAQMSAWSSGTWCTKKDRREQTLSRPPAALSRPDLPYASVLASPGTTSLHPHLKPCSRVRPPSSLSHPQSSHAASRSAEPCVACSCAAPATTPTPHSPPSVGPGVDASSGPHVVEVVPFVPAPPRNIKPKRPPPKHPQTPSVTAPPPRSRMPSRNPRLAPTPPALSPLLRRRASHAPPSHTPPHAELSHRHAHPSPARPRPHPPRPHAGSRSAAPCVACSCAAPATTPTPHSPPPVGPGVDASSVLVVVAEVPFVPALTPQHKTPTDPRPSTRKPPSVTAPPQHTRMPSHSPRLAPTPPALSPLLRRRSSYAPPSHTPPHAELSHRHAHPPTAAPASPARRLVLCRGLLLPRPCHNTHAALTWLRRHRCRCLVRVCCRRASPHHTCPHPAT